ncbi:MAG: M67 family metallopeptidase [Actinobacteria bacterium]|nr:M67 family metallopeptidase [Actinomycetota bacterium]
MLRLDATAYAQMLAHAFDGLPDEACGLLGGRLADATVETFVATRNADASSRTYSIAPDGWAAADRALDPLGLEVVGVMHSHTHTDAWPSPTDVAKADNPLLVGWHYVIVSLRHPEPVLRSFLLDGGNIEEEAVVLTGR